MSKAKIDSFRAALSAYSDSNYRYSLPTGLYTSKSWLAYETKHLLRREWICLGRVGEVPNAGDYFTLDVLGEPLLIVRGKDDAVRVLSNVCRHRNMQVAEGQGRARSFVCPYHAWSYKLDGGLLQAPLMPEVDRSNCGLPEFQSEVWQGFLFVNLDGKATPLAPRLTGLDGILKNYHTDEMHHVFATEEIWDANWKCLLENFMEGYHLSRVHPQTLGGRTPTKLCEKFESGEGYTGYRANYPPTAPFRGDCHPDLTEKEKSCSTLFSIFPAMVASQSSDVLAYMTLQPVGVDQVRIRWGLSVYDKDMSEEEIQSRVELWQAINAEDQIKLAKVQHALHSRSAVSGPLAPDDFEGTIRDIYSYLARRLQHAPANTQETENAHS